jgi:hypothetical protein
MANCGLIQNLFNVEPKFKRLLLNSLLRNAVYLVQVLLPQSRLSTVSTCTLIRMDE